MSSSLPVAFLINLDSDTERLAFMAGQLATLGLPFERVPAVRGVLSRNGSVLFSQR